MWIASKFGFYSIVCKDEDEFHIRARLRVDLENLLVATNLHEQIHQSDRADYRYRLVVSHQVVRKITTTLAETLDYPNFKNKIAETSSQESKLHAYHCIWEAMYSEQV
jgi:hypothetical protein